MTDADNLIACWMRYSLAGGALVKQRDRTGSSGTFIGRLPFLPPAQCRTARWQHECDVRGGGAVNLDGIDLDLLVALEALLAECSVTRAADRLSACQPAMSATLRACAGCSTTRC